jgi:exoribonuclease R
LDLRRLSSTALLKEYLIKGRRHGRKFRLGDAVRVRVARVNSFRSEIDFELV